MRDIPIIFSAPMIQALLADRKVQTRRLAWDKGRAIPDDPDKLRKAIARSHMIERQTLFYPTAWQKVQPGDRLWIRETWQAGSSHDGPQLSYAATPDYFAIDAWDGPDEGAGPSFNYKRCPGTDFSHWLSDVISNNGPWRSPIHLPRWASRLTLIVTATKIERLQDISSDDCEAEGIESDVWDMCVGYRNYNTPDRWFYTWPDAFTYEGLTDPKDIQRRSFQSLWISLHGPESWEANPDVVCLSFDVLKRNIDARGIKND